jgi:hypothetical protein
VSIAFKKTVAVFDHDVTIEEAETLLCWLLEKPNRKVNLKALQHAHTAVIQVLLATRPNVSSWPSDGPLSQLLRQHMQHVA